MTNKLLAEKEVAHMMLSLVHNQHIRHIAGCRAGTRCCGGAADTGLRVVADDTARTPHVLADASVLAGGHAHEPMQRLIHLDIEEPLEE